MVGPVIALINRTSRTLRYTKNGVQRTLAPGRNYVTSDVVRFAKEQNPFPGSEDPQTLVTEYLVGVEGTDDPVDSVPEEVLAQLPLERLDRTKLQSGVQNVETRQAVFPRGRVGVEAPTMGMSELLISDRAGS